LDYQNRKEAFIDDYPIYMDALYSMAIDSTIRNQEIKSLEARIVPKNTSDEISRQIRGIDSAIDKSFYSEEYYFKSKKEFSKWDQKTYFYVLHFTKDREKEIYVDVNKKDERLIASCIPRNHKRRKVVKNQSLSIVNLRKDLNASMKRVFGIDACSNEIGCRPEVFAQAFRYVRNHSSESDMESFSDEMSMPQLGATYHVGEDFLDVIDGLRAIDEVIKFLNFRQGDRLGHALALGIDVEEWYKSKGNTLVLPKQDYIDNIVWLLAKIREFNIPDMQNLVYSLENEYNKLFYDIYLCNFPEEEKNNVFTHMIYHDAWKLRGDNPELYESSRFVTNFGLSFWDRCAVNYEYPLDGHIRKNKMAAYLYYSYHYNPDVKRVGNTMQEFIVTSSYIKAACLVQKEMMIRVQELGLGIESNPSSNFLIGTFKRYDKHPILNLYNMGLSISDNEKTVCPQLFVSINTDDQGVFDTYLENEYALMASALEQVEDDKGNAKYSPSEVYDWLDRIRQMGLEQSFKK
jgi:hypothetical protein